MKVQLIADRFRKRVNGDYAYFFKGNLIEVDEVEAKRLLKSGAVIIPGAEQNDATEVDEPVTEQVAEHTAEATDAQPEGLARPANAANREKWDAYARAQKIDPTQFKTKDELIAAIPA